MNGDAPDAMDTYPDISASLSNQVKGSALKKNAKPAEVITRWLEQRDKSEVIHLLVSIVTQDRNLKKEWLLKAEKGLGRLGKGAIKKQITAAFPLKKYLYEYPRVRAYFASAQTILEELEHPIRELPASDQLALVEYGVERLLGALETVDDSGGFRYDTLNTLQGLMVDLVPKLNWPDDKKAAYLLNRCLTDEYGFYGNIPDDYEEVLTSECLASFYRQAQRVWDELGPADREQKFSLYISLERVLARRARQAGDSESLIAIKEKAATSGHDYVTLAELYLEKEDFKKAQRYLDKARKWDTHGRGIGHKLQVQLYLATGQNRDVVLCQWKYFQDHTSLESYHSLLSLAEQVGNKTDWSVQAVAWLQDNLEPPGKDCWAGWHSSDRADTLTQIYLQNHDLDSAWSVVQKAPVSDELLLNLAIESAEKSLDTHWDNLYRVFKALAIACIEQGNNKAYQEAVVLLVKLYELSRESCFSNQAELLIQELRVTYKRKRNFVGYLDDAFAVIVGV